MHRDFKAMLNEMRNSRIDNYAIPGLSSSLIGGEGFGKVRLFECSRDHQEQITPHSHRFDFVALVLRGDVRNIVWTPHTNGDCFRVSTLTYGGEPGNYTVNSDRAHCNMIPCTSSYKEGEWYSMKAEEIHSIQFDKGAAVLFFEGPEISDWSLILEPVVDGLVIPTFKREPWMFIRGGNHAAL